MTFSFLNLSIGKYARSSVSWTVMEALACPDILGATPLALARHRTASHRIARYISVASLTRHPDGISRGGVAGTWEAIAPMSCKRGGCAAAVLQNRLYAVGGFDGSTGLQTAERYDPATNTWEAIALMNCKRSSFAAGVLVL